VQSRFHRADLDAEHGRCLGIAQPGQVEEIDRLLLPRGKRCHCLVDLLGQLYLLGPLLRIRVAVGENISIYEAAESSIRKPASRPNQPRVVLAQLAAADIQADAGEPGAESLGAPQAVDAQDALQDRLVSGVLGSPIGSQHPAAHGQQHCVVPLNQLGERCPTSSRVATQRARHEVGVGVHGYLSIE
jgi:hypothetical protein